jgi:hypothetical protein
VNRKRTAAEDAWTEALVGRVVDGTATATVAISVRNTPYDITPLPGRPATSAEVFGQPASVFDVSPGQTQPASSRSPGIPCVTVAGPRARRR